jgi:UDP-N-acetylmuramate--alanine ligase
MIDLSKRCRFHIVGIGGAGMSAIATVLSAMGHEVTGSDLRASRALERLAAGGLSVSIGHEAANLGEAEAVAISTAIPENNPEVEEAKRRQLPVYSRADILAGIAACRRVIAVAGSHGKTTTSSMLSLILVEAGMQPSFIIGGDLNEIGTNAVWDEGEWMVIEADESDGTFLRLGAEIAIVTSLEPDHLEHYGGFAGLCESFATFVQGSGLALCYGDDPLSAGLLAHGGKESASFGTSEGVRFRASGIEVGRSEVSFFLADGTTDLGRFFLPVPGEHNALNATAAVGAALLAGAPLEAARRALQRFGGVARRFEFRGEKNGVTFVDDYAHLPGEVTAVLRAARQGGYERVVAVFQPHRYSRTEALAGQFEDSFEAADSVIVTSVYAAGEPARPGVSGQLVVDAVLAAHPDKEISYVPDHDGLLDTLRQRLRPGDLCITLDAGDLASLPDELLGDENW